MLAISEPKLKMLAKANIYVTKLVENFENLKTDHDVSRNSLYELKLKDGLLRKRNKGTPHWDKVFPQLQTWSQERTKHMDDGLRWGGGVGD